ncbi:PKD domain-containing protein [candidate division WOR-3 bacterium]|nr:PKD domain-containing protein [candidate division WOR-3 bacterium]
MKQTGFGTIIRATLLFALALVALPGCDNCKGDACLNEKTRVPDEDPKLKAAIVDTAANTVRLVYEPGAQLPSYRPGEVLLGALDGGYLVKVKSIEQRGDTLLVHSEPASLVEAFDELHIDTTFHLVPEARSYGPGRRETRVETTDGKGLTLVITWGELETEPVGPLAFEVRFTGMRCDVKDDDQLLVGWIAIDDVVYYKSIEVHPYVDIGLLEGLKEFRFIVSSYDSVKFLGAEAELTININVEDEVELASVPLGSVPLPIPVPPGAIPVEFQLRVLGGYEFNFLLQATARVNTDLRAGMDLSVGAMYKKDEGWTPYWDQGFGGTAGLSFEGGINVEAGFEAWLKGSLEAYICHLAGPKIWVRPYQYEEISLPPLDYDIGVGIEAGLGFRVKFLTYELADYDLPLADVRWSLFHPPANYPPATPGRPTGTTSAIPGTSYDYTTSTTDPDGDQVAYQFDWGDGDTSAWSGWQASGAQFSAAHAWSNPGNYTVRARARDENELVSDWSAGLAVQVGEPTVVFSEDFESYPVGQGIGGAWRYFVRSPSDLRIVSSGFTGKGLWFTDPTVDTSLAIPDYDTSFALAERWLTTSYREVEFRFKTGSNDFDWGIYACGDTSANSTRSWYLNFVGGALNYVDGSGNHQVATLTAGRWYLIRLFINWDARTYDIYVDGTLRHSAAPFRGSNPGGGILELVEFWDSWQPTDGVTVDDLKLTDYLDLPGGGFEVRHPVNPDGDGSAAK